MRVQKKKKKRRASKPNISSPMPVMPTTGHDSDYTSSDSGDAIRVVKTKKGRNSSQIYNDDESSDPEWDS